MVNYILTDIAPAGGIVPRCRNTQNKSWNRFISITALFPYLIIQALLSVWAELGQGGTFTCSSSMFHPVLIKFSAPVPPLCCRMTSSSVMMQSLGPGSQVRPGEAGERNPPIICYILQVAARLYVGALQKDVESFSGAVLGATYHGTCTATARLCLWFPCIQVGLILFLFVSLFHVSGV